MTGLRHAPWNADPGADPLARAARHIPSLAGLGVSVATCDATGFGLRAPLASNHNDKGTAFAGSIATLALLTGWCVATRVAEALGHRVDVAASRCELEFLRPLAGDLVARSAWPDERATSRLARSLARHGLARLALEVSLADEGGTGCVGVAAEYAVRVLADH